MRIVGVVTVWHILFNLLLATTVSYFLFKEKPPISNEINLEGYLTIEVDKPLPTNIANVGKPNLESGCVSDMVGYCLEYTLNGSLVQVTVENDKVKAIVFHGNTTTIDNLEQYDIGAYVVDEGMTHEEIIQDTGVEGFLFSDAYVQGTRVKEVLYGLQGTYYKCVFGQKGLVKIESIREIE